MKEATIELHLASHGGNTKQLFHIIGLIERAKKKGIIVKTIVSYDVYSAGSALAITGTPGERYIARVAEHMIHYGSVTGGWNSTPLQVERLAKHSMRHFDNIVKHYKTYSKVPDIESVIKDDSFYIPADKCIEWKLADKYLDEM